MFGRFFSVLISVMVFGGCSYPIGSYFDQSYLMVNADQGDHYSQVVTFQVEAVGEDMNVSTFFFSTWDDGIGYPQDLFIEDMPEGCRVMYEDDQSELVLTFPCDPILLMEGEILEVSMTIVGPWQMMQLDGIGVSDMDGAKVLTDLGTHYNPRWYNPDPSPLEEGNAQALVASATFRVLPPE